MDVVDEFLAHLESMDYRPERLPVQPDDRWHRLHYAGEKTSSGRYSLKILADGFAIASFGSDKDPAGFHSWHQKSVSGLTHEQRIASRTLAERARQDRDADIARRQERLGTRLAAAIKSMPAVGPDHAYLTRKGMAPGPGMKLRPKSGEILIPLYAADGRLWNIQRIKPSGWKGFWKGARVQGCYYAFARAGMDLSTLLICEGIATGASLHQALDLPVIVALNAGNLKPVAAALKQKYPASRLIFCSDHDQWTFAPGKNPDGIKAAGIPGDDSIWENWRANGLLWNPGLEKARAAAASIGGAVVIGPDFAGFDIGQKPTDFNDLHACAGIDAVRARISTALEAQPEIPSVTEEAPPGFDVPVENFDMHPRGGDLSEMDYDDQHGDFDMNFRVLGYNNGIYFYFPFNARQIVCLNAGSHTMQNLLQLDDLETWQRKFGGEKVSTSKIALMSANALIQTAVSRGVFQEEDRVRGCGAWLDDGRVILHCGDSLFVDGTRRRFEEVKSFYTYVAAPRLLRPSGDVLDDKEAYKLRQICEMVTWENPLSGALLAGWLVIAPVCAALGYRPHIYITGESESGKSTVMDLIIKPTLGRLSLNVDGGTTEPKIREMMGYDGRPLVFDEAEPSPGMEDVIKLARKASTGSTVAKFGQKPFKARFCACFSAINPPVDKTADENRISFMVIKKNRKLTAQEDFDKLLDLVDSTIDTEFSNRLIGRTLDNMTTLMENIKTFQKAARKVIGGARASQQIGTMLAGLYLLSSTRLITAEAAVKWIEQYDWTDHTIVDQQSDPIRLVQHIAGSLVRFGSGGRDVSIGDLIGMAYSDTSPDADRLLRYYGILVKDERVNIASRSQNLARLVRDTEWAIKWSRTLSDVPESQKERIVYFSPGVKTSAVSLPIGMFVASQWRARYHQVEEQNYHAGQKDMYDRGE